MKPGRGHNGRIKFGTEANGGFRNFTVANCTFRGCKGLALEEVDGGIMENITINNITMMDVADLRHLHHHRKTQPRAERHGAQPRPEHLHLQRHRHRR